MTMTKTHTFPKDPVLERLVAASRHVPGSKTIIHDTFGFEKTYDELFGDILRTRDLLRSQLPSFTMSNDDILHEDFPYVAAISQSGYEFLVMFFAIRASGGACMALGSGILAEEAEPFLSTAKAACILAGKGCLERTVKICDYVNTFRSESDGQSSLIPVSVSSDASPVGIADVQIDEAYQMAPGSPGMVLFTSGTSGFPKAAVLPKRCFAYEELAEPGSSSINCRPGHWIGGARNLIEPIVTGTKLYTLGEKATAEEVLHLFKSHRITHATFTPYLLRKMKELLTDKSQQRSAHVEQSLCTNYFKGLSTITCSAGVPEPSTMHFWAKSTGLPFQNVYSSTELGGPAAGGVSRIKDSIGLPLPGIRMKLSEGDHGEIRVKSPNMLTHYVGDEAATEAAFDEEGYYKTGDLAELRDGQYVFAGRANSDYVFFRFFQIPTLKVESSLMRLAYIADACVVAVPDYESKQLCGAIIRLKRGYARTDINLDKIGSDLRGVVPTFMLPTLLRVMHEQELLPLTVSGKPIKKQIVKDYFGTMDWFPANTPPEGVEYCGSTPSILEEDSKPWDWCGVQRSN